MYDNNYLAHYGIKGQRWGVRRFQNSDGSLTKVGKEKYNTKENFEKTRSKNKKIGVATTIAAALTIDHLLSKRSGRLNMLDIGEAFVLTGVDAALKGVVKSMDTNTFVRGQQFVAGIVEKAL